MLTLKKIALVAPAEQVSMLIAYLSSNDLCSIEHYPSLEMLEDEIAFPLGWYDVIVVDTALIHTEIDEAFEENIKAIFGECGIVLINSEGKSISDGVNAEVVPSGIGINRILEASLRASPRESVS